MKRFIILVLIGLLALSCRSLPFLGSVGEAPATEVGEGGTDTSGYFLADPKAGLEGLQSYTASLVITFSGTQDGQPLVFSDSYRQEVNQQSGTRFTWSSVTGMDGAVTETVTGKVGEAYYTRLQGGKCNVSWGSRAEGVEPFIPASLLPLVPAAKETSQQELDGLPATRGTVDAASLGFPGGGGGGWRSVAG